MRGIGATPVPITMSIAVTGAVTMTKAAREATGITTTGTVTGGTTIDASSASWSSPEYLGWHAVKYETLRCYELKQKD